MGFLFNPVYTQCTSASENAVNSSNYTSIDLQKKEFLKENRRLFYYLMNYYDRDLSPAYTIFRDAEDIEVPPLEVLLYLNGIIVISVNENDQVLNMIVEIQVNWIDQRLQWTESEFSGISEIYIRRKKLWLPDVAPHGCESLDDIRPLDTQVLMVNSSGGVSFRWTLVLGCICELDLTTYPFDSQTCYVKFHVYQHTVRSLVVTARSENETEMYGNDVWNLRSVNGTQEFANIETGLMEDLDGAKCNQEVIVNMASFKLQLSRNSLFYIVFIIMPTSLLSTLSLLAMLTGRVTPEEKLNKIGIGVGALTSMTLILTIVADSMPRKKSVPVLAIFVIANIALISLCTLTLMADPLGRIYHLTSHLQKKRQRENQMQMSVRNDHLMMKTDVR